MTIISDKNMTMDLVKRIGDQIVEEQLVTGNLFMTEQQVADRFNTSRRVAREAVGHLRTLGVLEARQRRGLTVSKPDPIELFSQTLPHYAQTPDDFVELSHLRYVLETGAVDLAVVHCTPAQIEQMDQAARAMYELIHQDKKINSKVVYELEYTFHTSILQATRSALVAGFHEVLIDYFQAAGRFHPLKKTKARTMIMKDAAREHCEIVDAFAKKDVERVRALLRHHLRFQMQQEA